jgi:IS1 family transposase
LKKNSSVRNIKLGGKNNVQIDETVIFKGSFISSPSNTYDSMSGLTWLVGLIEEKTGKLVVEIVENRKSETLTKLIRKHVLVGIRIITDGYPSYPRAAEDSLCIHEIVNHSIGLKK